MLVHIPIRPIGGAVASLSPSLPFCGCSALGLGRDRGVVPFLNSRARTPRVNQMIDN